MNNGEIIEYTTFDGAKIESFLVGDKNSKGAVIIIQEIWGLTNFIKKYSRDVNALGYLVMAPNLYSRMDERQLFTEDAMAGAMKLFFDVPPDRRGDPEFVKQVLERADLKEKEIIHRLMINRGEMENRMLKDLESAYNFLNNTFHPQKFGVVGFCMGGGLSFRISTILPFDATVVYYGANPPILEDIGKIKGPILSSYAGEDDGINAGLPDMVRNIVKFRKQLEMKIYPGTRHAFANNDGMAYNVDAAEDAWRRTSSFFKRYLQ